MGLPSGCFEGAVGGAVLGTTTTIMLAATGAPSFFFRGPTALPKGLQGPGSLLSQFWGGVHIETPSLERAGTRVRRGSYLCCIGNTTTPVNFLARLGLVLLECSLGRGRLRLLVRSIWKALSFCSKSWS